MTVMCESHSGLLCIQELWESLFVIFGGKHQFLDLVNVGISCENSFQKKILAEKPAISSPSYLFHEICGFMFSQIQIYSLFVLFFLPQFLIFFLNSSQIHFKLVVIAPKLTEDCLLFLLKFSFFISLVVYSREFLLLFLQCANVLGAGIWTPLQRKLSLYLSVVIYLCTSRRLFENSSLFFLLCLFPFSYFNKLCVHVHACTCVYLPVCVYVEVCRGHCISSSITLLPLTVPLLEPQALGCPVHPKASLIFLSLPSLKQGLQTFIGMLRVYMDAEFWPS